MDDPRIDAEIKKIADTVAAMSPAVTRRASSASDGGSVLEIKSRKRTITVPIQDNAPGLTQRGSFG